MSVKIFNGYKLPAMSWLQLQDFLHNLTNVLKPLAENIQNRLVTRKAVYLYDTYFVWQNGLLQEQEELPRLPFDFLLNLAGEPETPTLTACLSIINRQKAIKQTERRDPEVDFDFRVIFRAIPDATLAIVQTEQKEFVDIWNAQPGVEEYIYQDCTDRPKHISIPDWDKRRDDWSWAIDCTALGDVGTIYQPNLCVLPSVKKEYIPSIDERSMIFGKELAINEYCQQQKLKNPSLQSIDIAVDSFQWLVTDEGQEKAKEHSEKVCKILKELDLPDLYQELRWKSVRKIQ